MQYAYNDSEISICLEQYYLEEDMDRDDEVDIYKVKSVNITKNLVNGKSSCYEFRRDFENRLHSNFRRINYLSFPQFNK